MTEHVKTGTTILDELKICYISKTETLEDLRRLEWGKPARYGELYVYKTNSRHFHSALDICVGDITDRRKIATARFDRIGDAEDSRYFYMRIENQVLYDPELFRKTLMFSETLGMEFYHFTSMDLAVDVCKQIPQQIKKLIRDKDNTTIINGKAVKDRKKTIPNLALVYSTSSNRLKDLTIYAKQAKAANNKLKGVTVQAYNKRAEIEEASHKEYINEYYGNPKSLFRVEVHLNAQEINDYCNTHKIAKCEDLVFDQVFLSDIFYYHLSSVLRFSKGRNRLSWKDILTGNDRA